MQDHKQMLLGLPRDEILSQIPDEGVTIDGLTDIVEKYHVPNIVAQRFFVWQPDDGRINLDDRNIVTRSTESARTA